MNLAMNISLLTIAFKKLYLPHTCYTRCLSQPSLSLIGTLTNKDLSNSMGFLIASATTGAGVDIQNADDEERFIFLKYIHK